MQEFVASKEFLVYLIDAGAEMLLPFDTKVSYLQSVLEAVEENLKQRIIGRDDKVGICFFNTVNPPLSLLFILRKSSCTVIWVNFCFIG
jgi:hypothetical protein